MTVASILWNDENHLVTSHSYFLVVILLQSPLIHLQLPPGISSVVYTRTFSEEEFTALNDAFCSGDDHQVQEEFLSHVILFTLPSLFPVVYTLVPSFCVSTVYVFHHTVPTA